jgi:AcrR family transcriptional regulator
MSRTAAAETPASMSKGEHTRRAILRSAVERFGRDGLRATSVADIARDAGVGGTLAYAYFDNKQALFLAALDDDVVGVINEGVTSTLETTGDDSWRGTLILTLIESLERHPLARRMLAGLEPDVTDRIFELPALEDLRRAVVARLEADRDAGLVRADIDLTSIGRGTISIYISMLMAAVQFGSEGAAAHVGDVLSVIEAAIDKPARRSRRPPRSR